MNLVLLKDLINHLQAILVAQETRHPGTPTEVSVLLDYYGPARPDLTSEDLDAKLVAVEDGCWIGATLRIAVTLNSGAK